MEVKRQQRQYLKHNGPVVDGFVVNGSQNSQEMVATSLHLEVGYLLAAAFEEHGFYEVGTPVAEGCVFFLNQTR